MLPQNPNPNKTQQNVTLKARGLYTFPNALSEVPDGALSEAMNVIIDRDGVVNPRRGIKLYGDTFGTISDRSKQLLIYKDRILRHWTTKLDVDSDGAGTFTTLQWINGGDASVSEVETGTRIKYTEANGNLYFTTSAGIYKISCLNVADLPTSVVSKAGGIKALDGFAELNSAIGWFTQDSVVAYRVLWGIKDPNSNEIDGVPSERVIIYNPMLTLLIKDYNGMVADLATCAAVPSFTKTGDTHNTTTTIDNLPNVTNISVGMTVTGTNIPAGATVAAILSPTSIQTSAASTGTTAGVTITFDEKLKDTDYATLQISVNSTAIVLYNALKALANGASNKLDNDIGGTTFQSIALTPATTPDSPTPTSELVSMQAYYDNIINALNTTTGISTYAKSFIGGAFSNSTQSATVDLTFTVPQDVTASYFYQIYRTALFTSSGASIVSDLVPDDELRLVFEDNPTTAQISARSITFNDNVPESFRTGGANLYTNANSGEGISQANEPPPLALDVALFKGSTFYANTSTRYKKQIGLLTAVDLANRKLYIVQGSTVNHYTFVASVAQVTSITAVAGASYVNVGTSDYFDIYSADSVNHYRVWFQRGTSVAPGAGGGTLVQITITGGETAAQAATLISNALTSLDAFNASAVSAVVTVTNEDTGYTTAPSETVANAGFLISVSTTGTGEQSSSNKVGISNASTPAQAVDETARSLVRVINKNPTEIVNAFYVSGVDDLPGLIEIEAETLGDANFYIIAGDNTLTSKFNPNLQDTVAITGISAANPTHITSVAHGLATGDQIAIIGTDSTPVVDGVWTITKLDADHFTVPITVSVLGTTGRWIAIEDAIQGDNEIVPNRLYFSKFQQPEAVPLVNYQDVGAKNKAILRILPLRDSLFILTEGGVYRLSGDNTTNFQITLFDSSTQLKAVDSAVVLNNQIYMFSSQGIATISDTGISIISRPIENRLLPLVTDLYPNFTTATSAVSYESDRSYILFTVSGSTDTVATTAFRYNTFTSTWVQWDVSETCAVVNPSQDLMYFGSGDTNSIEIERKEFTRLDYADRQTDQTIPSGGVITNTLHLGSLFGAEDGDVFVQLQRLTVAQLNRTLGYMDTDHGLVDSNYLSTLGASSGSNLRSILTNLAVKIDADPGIATPGYAAAIAAYTDSFADTQSAYNVIVARLNADANTSHKNYSSSTGTVGYEVTVTDTNEFNDTITVSYAAPFVQGPITLYKKITSSVIWVPHHFGDPTMMKHVSESTILFETMTFSTAVASFSSDLSTGFEPITIPGEGNGTWGSFDWGQTNWGGEGTSRPFRTLIPVKKQRCRYINGKFLHDAAFENYAIFGISFTFSPISNRGYR
jgi:hypothetical protein